MTGRKVPPCAVWRWRANGDLSGPRRSQDTTLKGLFGREGKR